LGTWQLSCFVLPCFTLICVSGKRSISDEEMAEFMAENAASEAARSLT
jgi:hypothetical protein